MQAMIHNEEVSFNKLIREKSIFIMKIKCLLAL